MRGSVTKPDHCDDGGPSLTAWLKRAADRFQGIITALGLLSGMVAAAGPFITLRILSLSSGDLGFDATTVAFNALGVFAVFLATVLLAYAVATAVTSRTGLADRLRRHVLRGHEYGNKRVTKEFINVTILRVLRVTIVAALIAGSLVAYEVRNVRLAGGMRGETSAIFSALFWAAVVLTCGLAGCAALMIARPSVLRPVVLRLIKGRAWYRNNHSGMLMTVGVVLAGAATVVSVAAGAAVATEVRAGHQPGLLGSLIGVSASCVLLDPSSGIADPVLFLGAGEHDAVVIDRGQIDWLAADPARHALPQQECFRG